jgi:hypothetical protein
MRVLAGTQLDVVAEAKHVCPLSYSWRCADLSRVGQPTEAAGESFAFDNRNPPCSDWSFTCVVTATPQTTKAVPSALASLSVTYARSEDPPVIGATTYSPNLQEVQVGMPVTATVHATHVCDLTYSWDCGTHPSPIGIIEAGSGNSLSFNNPGGLCGDEQVVCAVTVTAPGWPPVTKYDAVELTYHAPTQAPVFTAPAPTGLLAPGLTRLVTASAMHPCTALSYSWECPSLAAVNQPTKGESGTFSFFNPGGLCADLPVGCTITASTPGHPSATTTIDNLVTYAAPAVPVTWDTLPAPGLLGAKVPTPVAWATEAVSMRTLLIHSSCMRVRSVRWTAASPAGFQ